MPLISNVPFRNALARVTGTIATVTDDWRRWFQEVKDAIDRAAQRAGSAVALTAQVASIAATAMPIAGQPAGLYRVSWLLRVTQAATTSGSAQISLIGTVDSVVTTQQGTAVANTLGAVDSGSALVEVDAGTDIQYAVTYASVGATPLRYSLDIVVEALPA